ncbi:hypothetical protein BN946_scf184951.g26 [Trametes cinnabarina]|uniref:alanine--glyoxylate transaminase n=1 Tax=Pycnoporus cinnabarinus TaxID=5643 RepID=A0A060STS5_PYCCI|nr:hypothetical protein BN946_scf184951.g26 [Trametes cinnabarina]
MATFKQPRAGTAQAPRVCLYLAPRNLSVLIAPPSPLSLCSIPGPIEVTDEVLFANAHPSVSHVSPEFIPVFGDCIRMIREVLFTADAQPFIISGSGTLGWDQVHLPSCTKVSANLVEPGENVLVLNSGYFGDSFADCLRTYGAVVDELRAPFGAAVELPALETALKSKQYKLVAFTHVDTSTGVLSDAKGIAEVVKRVSPETLVWRPTSLLPASARITLVALDGVCSVASEEIQMDAWGIDVVLTASQKGLGVPPGLSIVVASQKAIKVYESRKSPVTSYYASWKKWLPIMRAYESGSAAYFATPPVNLIYAFHASLTQLTRRAPSLLERFALHREASARVKRAAEELGLRQLPVDPQVAANGMTALWFPRLEGGGSPTEAGAQGRCRRSWAAQGLQGEVLPYRVRAFVP